jgi:Spy/CpxP family protein refolding chaperone
MSTWRTLIWCVVLLVGLPAMAGAQGFKWWQSEQFKTDLVLAPDQITKLEGVYQGLRPTLTSGKENLDQLEKRLSDVIAKGVAPEGEVMKLVDQVERSRSELTKTRTLMIYRMHQILTAEQRAKMNAMHDRWEKDRRQGRRPPGK